MFGHTIHAAPAALAGLFDAIWDIDMPDGDTARSLHINVLPIVAPVICLHFGKAGAGVTAGAGQDRVKSSR